MEHNQSNDNADTNVILLSLFLIFKMAEGFFTDSVVNFLQVIVALMLILVNLDKVYELSLKWYLKIKSWITKK